MTPLEQTMIRGMSFKLMVTIIGSTVAICATFFSTYFRFQNELNNQGTALKTTRDDIKDLQNTDHSMDLRITGQQLQINTQEVRINEIDKRLNK